MYAVEVIISQKRRRKRVNCYYIHLIWRDIITYRIAPFSMTLNDLGGHSPIVRFSNAIFHTAMQQLRLRRFQLTSSTEYGSCTTVVYCSRTAADARSLTIAKFHVSVILKRSKKITAAKKFQQLGVTSSSVPTVSIRKPKIFMKTETKRFHKRPHLPTYT